MIYVYKVIMNLALILVAITEDVVNDANKGMPCNIYMKESIRLCVVDSQRSLINSVGLDLLLSPS
jgi:hypothetical protein